MQQSAGLVFRKQKEQCLSAVDLSRKGSVDEPIRELVKFINQQENFVTTSSCSGRIVVFSYPGGEVKKKGCDWLFISHESCSRENVLTAMTGCQGDAFFKFESFVLHVQCATVEDAQTLLASAVASGYRNSGISISKRGKIVTAIRSTHGLEVPLTHNGEILVTEKYIEHLVNLSHVKMSENFSRIERLFENLKTTPISQNKTTESKKSRKSRKQPLNRNNIDSQEQGSSTSGSNNIDTGHANNMNLLENSDKANIAIYKEDATEFDSSPRMKVNMNTTKLSATDCESVNADSKHKTNEH